jgi:hypothetical protein
MDRRSPDPSAERRRLIAVNRAAERFFRRQLPAAKKEGLGEGPPHARWLAGGTGSEVRLVDRERAICPITARRRPPCRPGEHPKCRARTPGLRGSHDRPVPRRAHAAGTRRSTRDRGLHWYPHRPRPLCLVSPASQVYRRSNTLVGVTEQLDPATYGGQLSNQTKTVGIRLFASASVLWF